MSMTENEAKYYLLESMPIVGFKTHNEALNVAIQALSEIQQYRAIGTVEEFKALKEKNVAKKQGNINDFDSHLKLSKAGFLCCSSTNKDIRYPLISLRDLDYCPRCGQKLDWQ
jgi:hypothetical protein